MHKKLHIAMDKSLAHTNLFQVCVIFRLERTCMSALDIDAKIDGSCVCVHVWYYAAIFPPNNSFHGTTVVTVQSEYNLKTSKFKQKLELFAIEDATLVVATKTMISLLYSFASNVHTIVSMKARGKYMTVSLEMTCQFTKTNFGWTRFSSLAIYFIVH